jgi:hypothetical protein
MIGLPAFIIKMKDILKIEIFPMNDMMSSKLFNFFCAY